MFENKNIVILGKPSSGKTTLANKLKCIFKKHKILHTDDYLNGKYIDLIEEIKKYKTNMIIEGNLAYDLIDDFFIPDIIIDIKISDKQLEKYYKEKGNYDKIAIIKYYNKFNEQKLNKFLAKNKNIIYIIVLK